MKKTVLLFLLLLSYKVSAQTDFEISKFEIKVPMHISRHSWYHVPPGGYDRTSSDTSVITMQVVGTDVTYSKNGMSYAFEYRSYNGITTSITFLLDSAANKLLHFDYSYSERVARGETKVGVSFEELDFYTASDSQLVVKDSGYSLVKKLISATYVRKMQSPPTVDEGFDDELVSVVNSDTSDFFGSVTLRIARPSSVANESAQSKSILFTVLLNSYRLFFPVATRTETLYIYDILGREISRIEIPPGTTQYTLSTVGVPKGDYFARLGNKTGHFLVY